MPARAGECRPDFQNHRPRHPDRRSEVENSFSNLLGAEFIRVRRRFYAQSRSRKAKTNSAFMKPMQPSPELAKVVGSEPLPRSEVTKKVWDHIKKNKLQNPENKREIIADDKLEPVFGSKRAGHVPDDQGHQ